MLEARIPVSSDSERLVRLGTRRSPKTTLDLYHAHVAVQLAGMSLGHTSLALYHPSGFPSWRRGHDGEWSLFQSKREPFQVALNADKLVDVLGEQSVLFPIVKGSLF
jgi:hypothetical protein